VTRLNNSKFWVNADMIEFMEATPDTVISLVNGDKIVVKDPPEAVIKAIIEFRRQIFHKDVQVKESEKE
jgi:flagellar protein FlbD